MQTHDMNDPDAPGKRNYIDFAELEYRFPLTPEERMKITPDNLKELSQEQVDQIYARLPAGPVPDGIYYGGLFFPQGEDGSSRVGEIVGGIMGRGVSRISDKIEDVGAFVWKGKVFDRQNMVLRNLIEDRKALEAVIGDQADDFETIEVERKGFLSFLLPTRTTWLLFPAKLHCGQSLLDSRRESIIIDYAFTDDLPGYRRMPDLLAGRDGFAIRDEIRMVYPGFYLGRAYMDRSFVVNFVLYNKEIAERARDDFTRTGKSPQDCWTGTQQRLVVAVQKN
jgi:hypothetical protein